MEALNIKEGGTYLDGTMGGAGHSLGIINRLGKEGRLVCLDRDPMAIAEGRKKLENIDTKANLHIVQNEFADFDRTLRELKIEKLDGVLLDIGVSSAQLDLEERGFSYMQDGPLDMRMDFSKGKTAADFVNNLPEEELAKIFWEYGEERYSRRIAKAIVRERKQGFFKTTGELCACILKALPSKARREAQHPAKRTFQALRIAVNDELGQLEKFLEKIPYFMNEGGRILIISFHSLEDRMVKRAMKQWENPCTCPPNFPQCVCGKQAFGKIKSGKGVTADSAELEINPRSRSARLRVFEIKGDK